MKTRSGNIMRGILKRIAAGESGVGDATTLADPSVVDKLLAERLAASEALTLATLAATRERELAWDEVRSLLQDAGQLALRVLIPVLLAAL